MGQASAPGVVGRGFDPRPSHPEKLKQWQCSNFPVKTPGLKGMCGAGRPCVGFLWPDELVSLCRELKIQCRITLVCPGVEILM